MFTANYSCYILKKKQSTTLGILAAFAVIAAVVYGVGLFVGQKGPRGLEKAIPYILIATILLTALSFAYYFSKRFKIIITGENEKLHIEIKDPSLDAPLIITSPFNIVTQYIEQPMPKGGKMNTLYLTLYNLNNERFVTFEGVMGSAYTVPKKFEYINIFDETDRQRLILSPLVYGTGKVIPIADEISIYLNYIENRKKKTGQAQV